MILLFNFSGYESIPPFQLCRFGEMEKPTLNPRIKWIKWDHLSNYSDLEKTSPQKGTFEVCLWNRAWWNMMIWLCIRNILTTAAFRINCCFCCWCEVLFRCLATPLQQWLNFAGIPTTSLQWWFLPWFFFGFPTWIWKIHIKEMFNATMNSPSRIFFTAAFVPVVWPCWTNFMATKIPSQWKDLNSGWGIILRWSMYGVFAYIYTQNDPVLSIYTRHWVSGIVICPDFFCRRCCCA